MSTLKLRFRLGFTSLSGPALATLLAAALLVLAGGLQIIRSRNVAVENAKANARNLSKSLAQQATRRIESIELVLANMVEHLEDDSDRSQLTRVLQRQNTHLGRSKNIVVADAMGLSAFQNRDETRFSVADRGYFAWHRDHDDRAMHIDRVIVSRGEGRPILPLTRRFNDANNAFGGVVIGVLYLDELKAFYNALDVGAKGAIGLWSDDGKVILRQPAGATVNPDFRNRRLVEAAGHENSGLYFGKSTVDGVDRFTAFERLDRYPTLFVTTSLSMDEVMAPWRHESWVQGVILGIAALLLIGIGLTLELRNRQAKSSAEALAKSEALHRLLTEKASDMIAVKPTFGGPRSYVSPSSRNVIGWNPEEFAELPAIDYVHPGDIDRVRAENAALTAENPEITSVHRVRHKDGRWIWIEAIFQLAGSKTGNPDVIVTCRDITARREAEEALSESEARYRLLADTATDMIVLTDMNNVRRYVSPASFDLLGYTPEELTGLPPDGMIHPDDAADFQMTIAALRSGALNNTASTHRMRRKDGSYTWVEAKIRLIRDSGGRPSNIMVAVRDVSERQQQADDLRVAKEAAEAATGAKSAFLASMSHELRTPLNSVIGFSNLMIDASDLPMATLQHYARLVRDASTTLLSIVNDVLDMSKIEAGGLDLDVHPFLLSAMVESSVSMLREQAKANGLVLSVDIDPRTPTALIGDETRLRQILLNLLSNAVKFTVRGSVRLTVTCESVVDNAARVCFAIADTGIGIPQDKYHRLFQRFSQVDSSTARRFGGTGLGLSICKSLVMMMGSDISVASKEGEGSTFSFDLTLPVSTVTITDDLAPSPTLAPMKGVRILLAEDAAMNQELIVAMLSRWGHTVDVVADGAAAIVAVMERPYDMVLMDVQMPIMDGIEATQRIRALGGAFTTLPIVAMTANVQAEDIARCRAAGATDHFGKPFKPEKLRSLIENLATAATETGTKARPQPRSITNRMA